MPRGYGEGGESASIKLLAYVFTACLPPRMLEELGVPFKHIEVRRCKAVGWLKAPRFNARKRSGKDPRFQALVSTGSLRPYIEARPHDKDATASNPFGKIPALIDDDFTMVSIIMIISI